jgi:hypothetical protein
MKKAFHQTMLEIRKGGLNEEATEELTKLIDAVESTGKAGKLTLTIAIKPLSKTSGALEVKASVTTTVPKDEDDSEVFFSTPDRNLSRHDERQRELPGVSLATGTK